MKSGSIAKGIGIGVLLTAAGVGLIFAGNPVFLVGIGVIQLLWIVPACVIYQRRDETETSKGLLIVAGLVFLLNAGCWGMVMSGNYRLS